MTSHLLFTFYSFILRTYGKENDCLHTLWLCNLIQEVICTLSTVLTPVTGSEYFKSFQKPEFFFIKLGVFLAFKDIQQFDWNCFRRKKPKGAFFFFFFCIRVVNVIGKHGNAIWLSFVSQKVTSQFIPDNHWGFLETSHYF